MMPEGYQRHTHRSPLTDPWEPLFAHETVDAVQLALDFIDTARVGDCVEFCPAVLKVGRTLAFVDCRVMCGGRLIARGSATFRIL